MTDDHTMGPHSEGVTVVGQRVDRASSPHTTAGVLALSFGMLSFAALPVVGGVLAIALGHRARGEALRRPEVSDVLGRAGGILGWTNLALCTMAFLWIFAAMIPAV